jgi:hypothetical protein
MRYEIGCRVGALLSGENNIVQFLGYGVYQGDLLHPHLGFNNPYIKLDNGSDTWGCECWWGNENKIKRYLEGRVVVNVRLVRKPDGDYDVVASSDHGPISAAGVDQTH